MPSPFPGMDPYLEAHWGDVHQSLITYARDQLQSRLPVDLRARVEERLFVELPDGPGRSIYPDVHIVERPYREQDSGSVAVAEPAAEPLVIRFPDEEVTESYIEILDVRSGYRVVTAIEFVSLANKMPGPGRDSYLRKQKELRAARANSVEIDLLRAGESVLAIAPYNTPPEYRTTYRVCVWRAADPLAYEIYRAPLQERLPSIRIPLRPTDEDVILNLQALIEQCYKNGGYDDIDYKAEPIPPLSPTDVQWAAELLKAKA